MSSWVITWLPEKVVESVAPTASVAIGPPEIVALLSVTVIEVKVVFPVFLITKL